MISDNTPELPARNLTESEQLEFYRKRYGPMNQALVRQKKEIKAYETSIRKLSKAYGVVCRVEDRDTLKNLVETVAEVVGKHGV